MSTGRPHEPGQSSPPQNSKARPHGRWAAFSHCEPGGLHPHLTLHTLTLRAYDETIVNVGQDSASYIYDCRGCELAVQFKLYGIDVWRFAEKRDRVQAFTQEGKFFSWDIPGFEGPRELFDAIQRYVTVRALTARGVSISVETIDELFDLPGRSKEMSMEQGKDYDVIRRNRDGQMWRVPPEFSTPVGYSRVLDAHEPSGRLKAQYLSVQRLEDVRKAAAPEKPVESPAYKTLIADPPVDECIQTLSTLPELRGDISVHPFVAISEETGYNGEGVDSETPCAECRQPIGDDCHAVHAAATEERAIAENADPRGSSIYREALASMPLKRFKELTECAWAPPDLPFNTVNQLRVTGGGKTDEMLRSSFDYASKHAGTVVLMYVKDVRGVPSLIQEFNLLPHDGVMEVYEGMGGPSCTVKLANGSSIRFGAPEPSDDMVDALHYMEGSRSYLEDLAGNRIDVEPYHQHFQNVIHHFDEEVERALLGSSFVSREKTWDYMFGPDELRRDRRHTYGHRGGRISQRLGEEPRFIPEQRMPEQRRRALLSMTAAGREVLKMEFMQEELRASGLPQVMAHPGIPPNIVMVMRDDPDDYLERIPGFKVGDRPLPPRPLEPCRYEFKNECGYESSQEEPSFAADLVPPKFRFQAGKPVEVDDRPCTHPPEGCRDQETAPHPFSEHSGFVVHMPAIGERANWTPVQQRLEGNGLTAVNITAEGDTKTVYHLPGGLDVTYDLATKTYEIAVKKIEMSMQVPKARETESEFVIILEPRDGESSKE